MLIQIQLKFILNFANKNGINIESEVKFNTTFYIKSILKNIFFSFILNINEKKKNNPLMKVIQEGDDETFQLITE